jgi:hypothetical protein
VGAEGREGREEQARAAMSRTTRGKAKWRFMLTSRGIYVGWILWTSGDVKGHAPFIYDYDMKLGKVKQ